MPPPKNDDDDTGRRAARARAHPAAGALIGLQFVVMTLVAQRPPLRAAEAGAAFATPTIVHFGTALLLSAPLRAPWQAIVLAAALWGLIGLGGIAYALIISRRMRGQTTYQPEFEDWLFMLCCLLRRTPCSRYLHWRLPPTRARALFGVGAATLLLLFIGIHNAWDSIAYHVFVNKRDTDT